MMELVGYGSGKKMTVCSSLGHAYCAVSDKIIQLQIWLIWSNFGHSGKFHSNWWAPSISLSEISFSRCKQPYSFCVVVCIRNYMTAPVHKIFVNRIFLKARHACFYSNSMVYLFPRVQLMTKRYWLGWWLGTKPEPMMTQFTRPQCDNHSMHWPPGTCGCNLNTLRPRQNGHNFEDDVFKCNFLKENV